MPKTKTIISQTKTWLSTVVIEHGLCPFARREFDAGSIYYAVIETDDLESQLEEVLAHCAALDADPARETSLLIFPALGNFDDYLNLLDMAAALIKTQGHAGVYQIASFHPDYVFEDVAPDDPSHYTNRSPYPMLHILREASVEAALQSYPNPETIPKRNIAHTRDLGLEMMQRLLTDCLKNST